MNRRAVELLDFLDGEMKGLRGRIAGEPNAAQIKKLSNWKAIRDELSRLYSMESLVQERRSA